VGEKRGAFPANYVKVIDTHVSTSTFPMHSKNKYLFMYLISFRFASQLLMAKISRLKVSVVSVAMHDKHCQK
jgi:hypothetical protein